MMSLYMSLKLVRWRTVPGSVNLPSRIAMLYHCNKEPQGIILVIISAFYIGGVTSVCCTMHGWARLGSPTVCSLSGWRTRCINSQTSSGALTSLCRLLHGSNQHEQRTERLLLFMLFRLCSISRASQRSVSICVPVAEQIIY